MKSKLHLTFIVYASLIGTIDLMCSSGAVGAESLTTGFAEADITPEIGMEVPGGYSKMFCGEIHDPCKVRAVVFGDGKNRVAMVSVDSGFVFRGAVEQARDAIQKQCGIPPHAVLIGSTHSHSSGPLGIVQPGEYDHASPLVRSLAYEHSACANPEYLKRVCRQIATAVSEADKARVESRAGVGKGVADKVAFCRRLRMKNGQTWTHPGQGNPDIVDYAGRTDPEVSVLGAWDNAGKLRGCIVNFACHATTSPGGISANYIYYIEKVIRGYYGPGVIVLFFPGDSGDVTQVDNLSPFSNPDGDRWAQIVGGSVGAEALKVLLKMETGPLAPLDARNEVLTIKRRVPNPQRVKEALAIVRQDPKDVGATKWDFAKEIVMLDALLQKGVAVPSRCRPSRSGRPFFWRAQASCFANTNSSKRRRAPFPLHSV